MRKKSTGSRLNLGEPLSGDLSDFCEAHYGASETEIIRRALREFIDARLENEPTMRRRYEQARKTRLAGKDNIRLLKSNGD
jgi:hypothetical protein